MSLTTTIKSSLKTLALGLTALGSSYAYAQPSEGVVFNFENVAITDLTRYVAEVTGYNFTLDSNASAKVSIISPNPVPEDAVLEVYESLLQGVGYALVEDGGNGFKVIRSSEATSEQIQTIKGRAEPDDARPAEIITRILKLKYLSVDSVIPIIKPLLSKSANLSSFRPTNSLIITENFANISRLESIIKDLDTPSSAGAIELVPLNHADAAQVADIIDRIYEVKSREGTPVQIIPEVTSNKLIVVADYSDLQAIRRLVDKLDLDTNAKVKSVEIFYLKHADAKNLAEVLNEVITRNEEAEEDAQDNNDQVKKSSLASLTAFRAPVSVVADETTNALVLSADPVDMVTLQEVIRRLDIRRLQVYVEALIMEVSADTADQFGIEWRATEGIGSGSGIVPFGGVTSSANGLINNLASNPLALPSGFSFGLAGGTIDFNGTEFANIGMLINALKSESSINILSTPQLLTLDNEEAEIIVGDNVPFVTGSYSNSSGSADPFQTIERQDIGLTLRMTPQISENGFIQMKIYQEISSVAPNNENAADLITRKRSIKTSVVVPNGNMVVLGGLIRDDVTEANSAVPCLANIWGLGQLFKSSRVQNSKTNLMVFLKPQIINTFGDLDSITNDKYTQIRERQKTKPRKGSALVKRVEIPEADMVPNHLRDENRGLFKTPKPTNAQQIMPVIEPNQTPEVHQQNTPIQEESRAKKPQAYKLEQKQVKVNPQTENYRIAAPKEIKVAQVARPIAKEPVTLIKPAQPVAAKQLEDGEQPMLMPETALLTQNSVISNAAMDIDVLRMRTSAEFAPSIPSELTAKRTSAPLGQKTNTATSAEEFSAPAPLLEERQQAVAQAKISTGTAVSTTETNLTYQEPKLVQQDAVKLKQPEVKLAQPKELKKLNMPEAAINLTKPIDPAPIQLQETQLVKPLFTQPNLAQKAQSLPYPLAFIGFEDGSSKIAEAYLTQLSKIPNLFVDWSPIRLEVRAFSAATKGAAGRKQAIKRASQVQDFLVASGISKSKIDIYALSSDNQKAIEQNAVHVLRVR